MSFELVGVKLIAEDGGFFGTMAKADKAVVGFGDTSDKTFRQMPGLADIAVGAFHKVGAVAVDAFAQAGAAAVAFIGDSIGVAGDFESGMNKFAAVAGESLQDAGLELKDFRDQFIQIGKELPVSTAKVQQAAIEMVKGGIEPATIAAGGLKQVIQFAAAADLELEEASIIAAKALGGWVDMAASAQEKADFLAHSTDLLSKAANASTVNVDDLALGLYNVQGTAKLAGVSFDETVTALAQLAPSFASSADAGTSFKVFLSRLQPTTEKAEDAMIALGLASDDGVSKFYDTQGAFIGMEKAAGLLKTATEGLTEAQKSSLLQTIFGQDAIRVAAVLSEQGAEGYNNMAAALAKQNSVSEMAAQKQAGFNTAMDNFNGSVEALQITIGSLLLPVLTTLFNDYLAPGINILTDLAGALFGDADAFGRLSPLMQSIIGASGEMSSIWSDTLLPAIQAAGAYFEANILPILENIGRIVLPLLSASLQIAAAAWSNVLWPALQVVWAIIDQMLIPILKDVTGWLADNLPPVIKTLADFWSEVLLPAIGMVFTFISTKVIPLVSDLIGTHFVALNTSVSGVANFWSNTLLPAITAVWDFIDKNIMPLLKALANVLTAVVGVAVQGLTDKFNNELLPGITIVSDFINQYVLPDWENVKKGLEIVSDFVSSTIGPVMQRFADSVLQGWSDWFGDIASGISTVVGWLNDLADAIRSLPDMPDAFTGHSPPPLANWMNAIGDQSAYAANAMSAVGSSIRGVPASPMAIMAAGGNAANTYNQQRNVNLNYHTTYAPPVNQSLAIASALAG